MISHTHKCIFIHTPKCAGTSIEHALGHFDAYTGRNKQDHRTLRMLENPIPIASLIANKENCKQVAKRIKYRLKRQQNPANKHYVNSQQYASYYKFTTVRNPWDRAYSWYKNAVSDPAHRQSLRISQNITYSDFMARFIGKGFLKPQLYWLQSFDGELKFDKIMKFESLHEDFKFVSRALHLPNTELPKYSHGSETVDMKPRYSQALIDLISDYYAAEIDRFNYDFERDATYQ